ncbi:BTB/POZ domain-containing protein At1g01640-like [Papaver somniferum]|uniref:BTB/POZ domain-containing protein At1g01640-like n=1 Tax=Papaver somniferum TaxID=3469 RepID=UPI000E7060BE|nr:BTB/POZ domain-containing protein At1g01640-like [Papaver somniferum]
MREPRQHNIVVELTKTNLQERSISEDTNWGKRRRSRATMVEKEEGGIGLDGFLSDLADAFREGIYSDIQVKPSSGPCIRAHKFLLASRSKIFKNMLASDLCKAAPDDSISLSEFDHEELETFLEFLYRGDLPVEKFKKHYYSLLIAANKYVIPHLQKICEHQLLKILNLSNALEILELSEVVSNETLKVAVLKSIVLKYKEIVLTPEFDEFAKQNPQLVGCRRKRNQRRVRCKTSSDAAFCVHLIEGGDAVYF